MPIAPNRIPKPIRQPLPEFKSSKKKEWSPPNRQTFTVEGLGEELSVVSRSLLLIAATLAEPCEPENLKDVRDNLRSTTEHLATIYNRLMSNGVKVLQPEMVTVFHADDIPF